MYSICTLIAYVEYLSRNVGVLKVDAPVPDKELALPVRFAEADRKFGKGQHLTEENKRALLVEERKPIKKIINDWIKHGACCTSLTRYLSLTSRQQ